ncbi:MULTISPECIES: pyridoxamine 5'-phosphate oxidase family protein [Actinosynnema]|uniref:Uncharacterized protein n=1 Tax=Actinosynnema pretiosum TaxID=42197 RepID=A0A290ZDF5_9PSEU|nr:pyridoxamine 5'-phosphate oxidase family protein [Actinosynnema pretiosum]ATE57002.1 hypothetical protein CNX65_30015 [Actinosynnema pretiosum]
MLDSAGLEVLPHEECMRLLATQGLGRLVYTANALPVVHPVVYVVDRGALLMRVPRSSAAAGTRDSIVAFEVDQIADDLTSGWSVLVIGHVTEVVDDDALERARALELPSRGIEGGDHYLSMVVELMTGRRIPAP